ncbi:substrate-binding periplasmic protein [Noviherbaspirillum aridicola]|uniref:Solute-binding protein family 3/N-terminal domain-containing protein n=1 Tax=Noviherbaspirillum aridicola TaxID=2849687 RepID=A0ABQ4Q543_9BURK|nr:transporter substrate-binding domain-containing protein [Noviherbaspirillum aridicola]GIZ51859.1 hypothetical protein NCCP691_18730 [Noviherbaspirillum aridicola]
MLRLVVVAAALIAAMLPAQAATPLKIGIGLTKPPYIMAPASDLPGFEYEIAEKALAASGYRMQAEQLPPARALALMRADRLDGMLTVDEGIGGAHHFSEPYIHYQNVAVTLTARGIRLRHVDDLLQYSVAAFQNAHLLLGEPFRQMAMRHRNYREHPQQVTQNRLLFSGRVDVVVGDRLIFRYLTRELESPLPVAQAVEYHALFPASPRRAVFRDAAVRDAFNAGLKTIRRNGVYAAIAKKYQSLLEP